MKVMLNGHLIGKNQALSGIREAKKLSDRFKKAGAGAGIYPEYQSRPSSSGTPPHEYMLYQELGYYNVRAGKFMPPRYWYRQARYKHARKWNQQSRRYTQSVMAGDVDLDDAMQILANTMKEDFQQSIIDNDVIDWEVGLESVIAKWSS